MDLFYIVLCYSFLSNLVCGIVGHILKSFMCALSHYRPKRNGLPLSSHSTVPTVSCDTVSSYLKLPQVIEVMVGLVKHIGMLFIHTPVA